MVGTPGVETRTMLVWGVNESQRKWRNLPMTPDCFLDPNRGSGKWLCSTGVSGIGQCGQTRSTPSGLCEVAGAHQGRLRASVLPEED